MLYSENTKFFKGLQFVDFNAGIGYTRHILEDWKATHYCSIETNRNFRSFYFKNFKEKPIKNFREFRVAESEHFNILIGVLNLKMVDFFTDKNELQKFKNSDFYYILKIAKYLKPELIILEINSNFKNYDNGIVFDKIRDFLIYYNYFISVFTMNSCKYGSIYSKERDYLIIYQKNNKYFKIKKAKVNINNETLKDYILPEDNVEDFIIKDYSDLNLNEEKLFYSKNCKKDFMIPVEVGEVFVNGKKEKIYHEMGRVKEITINENNQVETGLYYINNKLRRLSPKEYKDILEIPPYFALSKINEKAYKQINSCISYDNLYYILKPACRLRDFIFDEKNLS